VQKLAKAAAKHDKKATKLKEKVSKLEHRVSVCGCGGVW
jgi:hypothetical protein